MTTSTPREPQPAGPVLRPLVWSALLGVIVSAAVARPVSADPSRPHTVPDTGIRPIPNGSVRLPDATAPRATDAAPPQRGIDEQHREVPGRGCEDAIVPEGLGDEHPRDAVAVAGEQRHVTGLDPRFHLGGHPLHTLR